MKFLHPNCFEYVQTLGAKIQISVSMHSLFEVWQYTSIPSNRIYIIKIRLCVCLSVILSGTCNFGPLWPICTKFCVHHQGHEYSR